MAFLKNILSRLAGGGADPAATTASRPGAPSVRLAAFGKHPAWDDHMDDVGLDTERLVEVKRAIYLGGVGANLDAGTWNPLGPGQRLGGFDHLFLWRAGGRSTVAGRAVASTDGKGRGRYPMVLAAECAGIPPARVAGEVAPVLDDALARCRQTGDRGQTLAILADAGERLDAIAAGAAPPASPRPPTLADLVASPELGQDGAKLASVLFQVEREMKAFAPPAVPVPAGRRTGGGSRLADAPAVHLRVPACVADPAQAVRLWADLLADRLDPWAPVLAIAAVGQGWVDLLVGTPRPPDFFCLLASREMIPFTTDIPFNMDAPFLDRARRWIADQSATAAPAAPGVIAEPTLEDAVAGLAEPAADEAPADDAVAGAVAELPQPAAVPAQEDAEPPAPPAAVTRPQEQPR
jgi:hypothetical protein